MKLPRCWRAWLLVAGLVVLGSCKSDVEGDDTAAVDPLDDPWVDAIDSGGGEIAAATDPQVLPSAPATTGDPVRAGSEHTPPASAEAGSGSEAQPSTDGDGPATTTSPASAGSGNPTAAPAAAPVQSPPEAPAIDGQAVEPAPAPAVEPAPAPNPEPAQPPVPAAITSADFHGSYRYAGGNSQRTEVADAIETTVNQLAALIRGIARKRLTKANPVDSTLDIVVAGDKITTSFASGFSVSCVIDGAAVRTKGIDGERLDVRVRWKGNKIVQHMQGKDGARTVVYVLSADRKTLTVHHKITASRLPEPLTYRLSFTRK